MIFNGAYIFILQCMKGGYSIRLKYETLKYENKMKIISMEILENLNRYQQDGLQNGT